MTYWIKSGIILLSLFVLSACGGSSSSGGSPPVVVQAGVYSGESTLSFFFDDELLDSQDIPLNITVAGSGLTTEIIIAYREFSGTSALGPNQEFSIPSGRFTLFTQDGVTCRIQIVFTGRFVGQSASGTIQGDMRCNPGNTTFIVEGTFNVSLSSQKALLDDGHFKLNISEQALAR